MSVKQISVFLENKPGTLNEMMDILAKADIDIRAMALSEARDFGIARIVVDDVLETTDVLKTNGYITTLTPVLIVGVPNQAGGLSNVLNILNNAGVNIEYMYAILSGEGSEEAFMIFRLHDEAVAEKALAAAGIKMIDQSQVSEL
jgi:hypothetical protein